MRLIEPSVELIKQGSGLEGMYRQIELAGRTCYKSEDKITEDSAKKFVDRMIESKHYAMLEHGTVYLTIPIAQDTAYKIDSYNMNKYSIARISADLKVYYVTTNLRVLVENNWEDDIQYICEPTKHHVKRYTAKFICDRGVSHEFVRHRVFSFAQESQRYCNYTKDKFGDQITYVIPSHLPELKEGEYTYWDGDWCDVGKLKIMLPDDENNAISNWLWTLNNAAHTYALLCDKGWKPQEARGVLPNATKTELVMTGFESDWEHFFDLRSRGTTGAPHPDAKYLADKLLNLMKDENTNTAGES